MGGEVNDFLVIFSVQNIGFMQPQGHVQVLLNQIEFNMSPQAALDAPRICINTDGGVFVEEGIDDDVVTGLLGLGHEVKVLKEHQRAMFGRGQIIERLENGALAGGSDGRGDGCACPLL